MDVESQAPRRSLLGRTAPAVVVAGVLALAATHVPRRIDGPFYAAAFLSAIALSVALALGGARRHRRTVGAAGWLIAVALVCALIGNGGYYLALTLHGEPDWPGWTDIFYLGHFAVLSAAALTVLRRRGARNAAALIDATTLVVGVAVVAYVFAVAETVTDPAVEPLARVLNGLYPLLDVFVLGLAVRLLLGSGQGGALLLAGGMATQFVGDMLVLFPSVAASTGEIRRLIDVSYLVCYLMLGSVLWHRDADQLVAPEKHLDGGVGPGRLLLFGLSGLLAPATLLIRTSVGGDLHARAIALAGMVMFVLTLARMALLVQAVQDQSRRLALQARTDPLTGLANRRTFDFELDRAMRNGAVVVALIDLDRFKTYNDAHGHGAGDQLLRECAARWAEELADAAPGSVLARYGGEEFAVVLRATTAEAAAGVMRRLLARTPTGQTFSAGVALWDGAEDALTLFRRADELMYQAKAAGRNRVVAQAAPVPSPT